MKPSAAALGHHSANWLADAIDDRR